MNSRVNSNILRIAMKNKVGKFRFWLDQPVLRTHLRTEMCQQHESGSRIRAQNLLSFHCLFRPARYTSGSCPRCATTKLRTRSSYPIAQTSKPAPRATRVCTRSMLRTVSSALMASFLMVRQRAKRALCQHHPSMAYTTSGGLSCHPTCRPIASPWEVSEMSV